MHLPLPPLPHPLHSVSVVIGGSVACAGSCLYQHPFPVLSSIPRQHLSWDSEECYSSLNLHWIPLACTSPAEETLPPVPECWLQGEGPTWQSHGHGWEEGLRVSCIWGEAKSHDSVWVWHWDSSSQTTQDAGNWEGTTARASLTSKAFWLVLTVTGMVGPNPL